MNHLTAFISHDELTLWFVLVAFFLLALLKRFPPMDSVERLVHLLDSRGGNIAILGVMSWMFFLSGMRLIYRLLGMVADKTLTPDNAVAQIALVYVTGTAFGGAFGAFVKTMTGSGSQSRGSDNGNGNGGPADPGQKR